MSTNKYTECYIAFLDILGFKELVKDSSCSDIIDIFKTFNHKPISEAYLGNDGIVSKSTVDALKMKVMSDSICLYINVKVPDALMCILASCIMMQFELLSRPTPIFLRGAITLGDVYAEKDITFGPGLTSAYLMEENNTKYPRIILTKEVLSNIDCSNPTKERIVNTFAFKDFDAFYALNYFNLIASVGGKLYENIALRVNNVLDTTTDSSIREKYLYFEKKLREKVEPFMRDMKNN